MGVGINYIYNRSSSKKKVNFTYIFGNLIQCHNIYEPRRDDSLLTGLETTKGKTVGTINILADGVEQ